MRLISFVFVVVCALPAFADGPTDLEFRAADDAVREDFLWRLRPVIVFADSELDPRYIEQITLLKDGAAELVDRDVIVITDTDPSAMSPLRTELRPRGFMLVLLGKDGEIRLRKPFPWDVREISRSIDKIPLRQREIQDRREPGE